jgi:hydrogenase maturation protease
MPTLGSVKSEEHNGCGAAAGLGSCRCGRRCSQGTAPVLLLAIGNPLMADDGAGQEILSRLESDAQKWGHDVELVDGGTQGLALLGKFEQRKAVVFLDAVRLGYKAGAVHVLNGKDVIQMGRRPASSAHEGSAPDILRALELLGETPSEVTLIGIEPERIETRIGLSATVQNSIGLAAGFARMTINRLLSSEDE